MVAALNVVQPLLVHATLQQRANLITCTLLLLRVHDALSTHNPKLSSIVRDMQKVESNGLQASRALQEHSKHYTAKQDTTQKKKSNCRAVKSVTARRT